MVFFKLTLSAQITEEAIEKAGVKISWKPTT